MIRRAIGRGWPKLAYYFQLHPDTAPYTLSYVELNDFVDAAIELPWPPVPII